MEHQDWKTIVFYNNNKINKNENKEIKKKISKNSSNTNDMNMRKLDQETENFKIDKISHDLKTNILKARNAKKLNQKQWHPLVEAAPIIVRENCDPKAKHLNAQLKPHL